MFKTALMNYAILLALCNERWGERCGIFNRWNSGKHAPRDQQAGYPFEPRWTDSHQNSAEAELVFPLSLPSACADLDLLFVGIVFAFSGLLAVFFAGGSFSGLTGVAFPSNTF